MRALMTAMIIKKGLNKLEKKLVLQETVILEPEISRIFVGNVIVENIITINSPSSSNPLVELFIHNTLFGELIIDVMLSGNLELSISAIALVIMMFLMAMIMSSTTSY
jgi:hypothetical protein